VGDTIDVVTVPTKGFLRHYFDLLYHSTVGGIGGEHCLAAGVLRRDREASLFPVLSRVRLAHARLTKTFVALCQPV
jgi:hypothetical protein